MFFRKTIIGLGLIFLATQSLACCTVHKNNLYFGADAQLHHMSFDKKFGASVMRKNHKQGNVYMGYKLSEHWGIEVGRESTFTRTKQVTLQEGQIINGKPLPAGLCPATFITSIKAKGPHVDLVYYRKIFERAPLDFIASIGLTHITVNVARDNVSFGKDALPGPSRSMKKGFLAMRPMAGLQYNCDNGLSLRTTFSWIDTAGRGAKAKDSQSLRMQNRPAVYLKDSFVLGVGFLVNI